MSYTITIGEAEMEAMPDDCARVVVRVMEREDAPLNTADDRSNSISPAYGAWEDFARRTELYALFFGQGWIDATERYRGDERHHRPEQPILKSHPGATLLTAEDHHEVQQARARFQATVQGSALYEADQKRLAWLDFWMGWALANCKTPVIANS